MTISLYKGSQSAEFLLSLFIQYPILFCRHSYQGKNQSLGLVLGSESRTNFREGFGCVGHLSHSLLSQFIPSISQTLVALGIEEGLVYPLRALQVPILMHCSRTVGFIALETRTSLSCLSTPLDNRDMMSVRG